MSTFDPGFWDNLREIQDGVNTDLTTAGILFREYQVHLVTVAVTGADPAAGEPGTLTETLTELTPRPKVDLRQQWRWVDGAQVLIGDAKVTVSRDAATEAAIKGAKWIRIGSVDYTLVEGEMRQKPLNWELVLKRER